MNWIDRQPYEFCNHSRISIQLQGRLKTMHWDSSNRVLSKSRSKESSHLHQKMPSSVLFRRLRKRSVVSPVVGSVLSETKEDGAELTTSSTSRPFRWLQMFTSVTRIFSLSFELAEEDSAFQMVNWREKSCGKTYLWFNDYPRPSSIQ